MTRKSKQFAVVLTTGIFMLAVFPICVATAYRYKNINISRSAFKTTNIQALAPQLHERLSALETTAFGGRTSCDVDSSALSSYIDTLQLQASDEHWKEVTFKIAVACKKTAAGFDIEYTATTSAGLTVAGGGTMVTDRPAVSSFIQSELK